MYEVGSGVCHQCSSQSLFGKPPLIYVICHLVSPELTYNLTPKLHGSHCEVR